MLQQTQSNYGYFSYALVGQFGDSVLIVDPYTLAKKNQVAVHSQLIGISSQRHHRHSVLEALIRTIEFLESCLNLATLL